MEDRSRRLATALDLVAEAVAILDAADGAVLHANTAFKEVFGTPDQGILRPKLAEFLRLGQDDRFLAQAVESARCGQPWSGHAWLNTCTNRGVKFEVALSPVCDEAGAVESLIARLRDITIEDEKDRDLRLAQKMSALGALAGGVAHDFNNLIGAMLNAAELIEKQVGPDSTLRKKLEIIHQAGDRARGLTAQILNFGRRAQGDWTSIDLTGLVTEVTDLLQASLARNIRIQCHAAKGIVVIGDASQLHQVIMNLGINASQAMQPDGGTLTIRLRGAEATQGGGDQPVPESCIQLSVEDTGCGMDPRTLDRIFEPFFTTKEPGHGTGLGLSVVYDIVQRHGGKLQVLSRPGKGSSFHVYLPVNHDRRKGMPTQVTELQTNGLRDLRPGLGA